MIEVSGGYVLSSGTDREVTGLRIVDWQVVLMAQKLDAGTTFPTVDLTIVSGDTFTLPDDIANSYQVVLFFRGHW